MNKRKSLFDFVAYCGLWGSIIGLLLGIGFFLWGLWVYGLMGLVINVVIGWVVGMLNGFVLGFLSSKSQHIKTQLAQSLVSMLITAIASFMMYYALFSPLTHAVQGRLIFTLPPVAVATVIAVFLSQRALNWYSNFESPD